MSRSHPPTVPTQGSRPETQNSSLTPPSGRPSGFIPEHLCPPPPCHLLVRPLSLHTVSAQLSPAHSGPSPVWAVSAEPKPGQTGLPPGFQCSPDGDSARGMVYKALGFEAARPPLQCRPPHTAPSQLQTIPVGLLQVLALLVTSCADPEQLPGPLCASGHPGATRGSWGSAPTGCGLGQRHSTHGKLLVLDVGAPDSGAGGVPVIHSHSKHLDLPRDTRTLVILGAAPWFLEATLHDGCRGRGFPMRCSSSWTRHRRASPKDHRAPGGRQVSLSLWCLLLSFEPERCRGSWP